MLSNKEDKKYKGAIVFILNALSNLEYVISFIFSIATIAAQFIIARTYAFAAK